MCPEACGDVSDCPRGAACSEPMCLDGACFLAPTGEACASGFVCIPERGCEPTGSMDGGTGCVDGMPCSTGNECERGRTDCSSWSAVCVADGVMDAGVSCRAADNECDVEEFCDGVAPTCPTDGFADVGTPCTGGFCNGPACGACQPGVACETANACETGTIECADGVPTCVASGVVAAGTECREAAGPCDVAELCDGTSPECPADAFQPPDFVCRAAAGTCDQVEVCDGATPACPADAFDMSTECRPAVGPCDLAEVCSGGSIPLRGSGARSFPFPLPFPFPPSAGRPARAQRSHLLLGMGKVSAVTRLSVAGALTVSPRSERDERPKRTGLPKRGRFTPRVCSRRRTR